MKILTLLAILTLGGTAFAEHRNYYSGSRGSHGCRSYSSARIRYTQPCYSRSYYSYRPTYYRSSYCRSYPSIFRSGFFFRPAISLTYSSGSPRYYGGSSRSYLGSSGHYDDSSSIEADVQRALKRRGYYRGYVDGDIGPESREAIRAWQYEHGLAATGRVDSALLRSLGI